MQTVQAGLWSESSKLATRARNPHRGYCRCANQFMSDLRPVLGEDRYDAGANFEVSLLSYAKWLSALTCVRLMHCATNLAMSPARACSNPGSMKRRDAPGLSSRAADRPRHWSPRQIAREALEVAGLTVRSRRKCWPLERSNTSGQRIFAERLHYKSTGRSFSAPQHQKNCSKLVQAASIIGVFID